MRILLGPSDEETKEVFRCLSAEDIFYQIRNFDLDEKWFQQAVYKGLLKDLSPEEILLKADEGGSLKYVQKSHVQLIKNKNNNIKDIMDEAICKASKYSHVEIVKYLFNFGADINLVFFNAEDAAVLDFAIENGAMVTNKLKDKTTGDSHSVLWFMLEKVNSSLADYVEKQVLTNRI